MKKILILICFFFLTSVASAEDCALVQRAEEALNKFKTAQGYFKQYNNDGSIFTGEFWIQKPGKIRFDYAYPNKNFMVSNGSFIFYWDEDLQQQTNVPLSYTPAGFILSEEIAFKDDVEIKKTKEDEDSFTVDISLRENEDMGLISLLFNKTKKGDVLKQWKVQDLSGNNTIIRLSEVVFDQSIDKKIFRFKDPRSDPFKLN